MTLPVDKILQKKIFQRDDIIALLQLGPPANSVLFKTALEIKRKALGRKVFFRGLIEYSNKCSKNCFYCGIRSHNTQHDRYHMTDREVIEAVKYAHANRFGSVVIQSGETKNETFISTIERLLQHIKQVTNGEVHVTLSLGEQSSETYHRWLEAGAHRYLLRIETSNPDLYKKLHPADKAHNYDLRMEALSNLKKLGYQVGTGVMIGLPFQTIGDLADDLLLFRKMDIDMVGMGPYIEHEGTPLYQYHNQLPSLQKRLETSLNMIAVLRILMKNINIASTTAMQTIDPRGRELALLSGANVMMPNLTPFKYKGRYLLYRGKPGLGDHAEESKKTMEDEIRRAGGRIGYGEWGDSKHFKLRTTNNE